MSNSGYEEVRKTIANSINKKYELKKALKGCTYGDANDKKYVKELIYDILYREYGVDETNISKAIPFDVPSLLTSKDKFDIILYMYKNEFGNEALTNIINKYNLADLRYIKGNEKPCYVITEEDIDKIFEKENFILTYDDKLKVLVQRIYESYKGYSVIDEIREMNIDGVSGRSIRTSRCIYNTNVTIRRRLFKSGSWI